MNFLAHLCLADGSPDSIAGNLLGDFVKGNPDGRFAPAVVRGIRLHRAVDTFTDGHPVVRRAIGRIAPVRRRYAGIAIDMAFDHFLARAWQADDAHGFAATRQHAYAVLLARRDGLPERLQAILPSLTGNDWLGAYARFDGIAGALERMSGRLTRANALGETGQDVAQAYDALEQDFLDFWPTCRAFAATEHRRLARLLPDSLGTTNGHESTRMLPLAQHGVSERR
ncbi:MAG: ACP phosphodiesterase [Halofilum sp. (in: g-proteobacteria)]